MILLAAIKFPVSSVVYHELSSNMRFSSAHAVEGAVAAVAQILQVSCFPKLSHEFFQ